MIVVSFSEGCSTPDVDGCDAAWGESAAVGSWDPVEAKEGAAFIVITAGAV